MCADLFESPLSANELQPILDLNEVRLRKPCLANGYLAIHFLDFVKRRPENLTGRTSNDVSMFYPALIFVNLRENYSETK